MSLKSSRIYRVFAGMLCLLIVAVTVPQNALAAQPIETDKNASITIRYLQDKTPVSGISFSLYRVASLSASSEFILLAPFSSYSVSLNNMDNAAAKALAQTLAGYISRDSIIPFDEGVTNEHGLLVFPKNQEKITAGMYLIIGQRYMSGNHSYTPEPFILSLPIQTTEGELEYDVTVEPKYDSVLLPPEGIINLKALKVWKDSDHADQRPAGILVQLLRDGKVFDTVSLNAENNWRYTWENLDNAYQWRIVEKQLPKGYTVSVSREGITFVITNTFEPTDIDDPDVPEKPKLPEKQPPKDKLPQTGMLWWPVPVLAAVGLLIFLIGWVRLRKKSGNIDE